MLAANHYVVDFATNRQTDLEEAIALQYDLIVPDSQIPQRTRIRALLQRSGARAKLPSTLTWGESCLNLTAGTVRFGERVIPLTATGYNLLQLFLHNPHHIFIWHTILSRLWGFDDAPRERAIATHVQNIRKKLKAGCLTKNRIETIYGMGYRLKPHPKRIAFKSRTLVTETNSSKKCSPSTEDIAIANRVLDRLRDSYKKRVAMQVARLEQAKTAFLAGSWDEELLQAARDDAHKLAGSMATFGYPEGSKLGRAIEHLLMNDRTLTPEEISQFSQLVTALQEVLLASRSKTTERGMEKE